MLSSLVNRMWHDTTRHDTTWHDTKRSRFRAIVERRERGGEGRREKNTRKESKRGEEEGREGGGTKMIRGSRENASYRDESGTWTLDGFTCVRFYQFYVRIEN